MMKKSILLPLLFMTYLIPSLSSAQSIKYPLLFDIDHQWVPASSLAPSLPSFIVFSNAKEAQDLFQHYVHEIENLQIKGKIKKDLQLVNEPSLSTLTGLCYFGENQEGAAQLLNNILEKNRSTSSATKLRMFNIEDHVYGMRFYDRFGHFHGLWKHENVDSFTSLSDDELTKFYQQEDLMIIEDVDAMKNSAAWKDSDMKKSGNIFLLMTENDDSEFIDTFVTFQRCK